MRKATYISDGFRMRAGPLGPENALKTNIYFLLFSKYLFFKVWAEPLGLWFHGATVGPYVFIHSSQRGWTTQAS